MLLDLSARAKLRVSGNDRVRFLNGQVTNDVRKANENLAMPAAVLNAKGRMDAFVFISAKGDELLLDAEPELRESLGDRLERYAIADDVTFADATEEYTLFHFIGDRAPESPNELRWRRSKRFGVAGWDLWCDAMEHDRTLQLLAARDVLLTGEEAERFRIERGVPRWGRELTNEIIPPEANLEIDAVDYTKGCYIGQEVISRMKISGQTNKRLCGLISAHDAPLVTGMKLVAMSEEGKEVGRLTSATTSPRCGEIALGFVKRSFNSLGTELDALAADAPFSSALTRVRVVALPFAAREAR
ncbi:MAG TPA: glycine cleavage T C-terminal barrel domain-containing protein [Chthoniobacterales bacterium]